MDRLVAKNKNLENENNRQMKQYDQKLLNAEQTISELKEKIKNA